MHYIAGTQIVVKDAPRSVVRPGMSRSQVKTSPRSGGGEETKLFKPGVLYTLIRVYQSDGKVMYVFSGQDGNRIEVPFTSVSAAEKFISSTRGEQLPDKQSRERTD